MIYQGLVNRHSLLHRRHGWPDRYRWYVLFVRLEQTLDLGVQMPVTKGLNDVLDRFHDRDMKGNEERAISDMDVHERTVKILDGFARTARPSGRLNR